MSLKEFDKLAEKIGGLVQNMRLLKEENQRLQKELQEMERTMSSKDGERNEIKKKISTLLELVDSIEANVKRN